MSYTKRFRLNYILGLCCLWFGALQGQATVRNGADQLDKLLPLLEGKRVSLVVNHTSLCGKPICWTPCLPTSKSCRCLHRNTDSGERPMPEKVSTTGKTSARESPSVLFTGKTRNRFPPNWQIRMCWFSTCRM